MDEISKHWLHSFPRLCDQLSSLLLRGANLISTQLLASTGLQDLLALLPHRARLRCFKAKQSEFHNFDVQSTRHHMAFLRVSCVSNFPECQLRTHQVNN